MRPYINVLYPDGQGIFELLKGEIVKGEATRASRNYLGNPKLPTVFVHQLIEGQYQVKSFRGTETILSATFSKLELNVEEIIQASGMGRL